MGQQLAILINNESAPYNLVEATFRALKKLEADGYELAIEELYRFCEDPNYQLSTVSGYKLFEAGFLSTWDPTTRRGRMYAPTIRIVKLLVHTQGRGRIKLEESSDAIIKQVIGE